MKTPDYVLVLGFLGLATACQAPRGAPEQAATAVGREPVAITLGVGGVT